MSIDGHITPSYNSRFDLSGILISYTGEYAFICSYIYIYIYRERERQTDRQTEYVRY